MNRDDDIKIEVIELPPGKSLYERGSAALLDKLFTIAENTNDPDSIPIDGVLLLQKDPADDNSQSWLDELEQVELLDNLTAAIDKFRWLLSLIRNSRIPWLYSGSQHCLGSHWDLAMSCQKRFWFSTTVKVGYPEIMNRAFPPGGVLESLEKKYGKVRDKWQEHPTQTVAHAFNEGLIDFSADADDWLRRIEPMFKEMLLVNPNVGVRPLPKMMPRESQVRGENPSGAALAQIEAVWQQSSASVRSQPAAWDYCWQLVKERSKLKDGRDLGRLIARFAARHFLSPGFKAWLAAGIVNHPRMTGAPLTSGFIPPVAVDSDGLAPPTKVFARLLQAGVHIVFVGSDARGLAATLDLVFSRLERSVTSSLAQSLWNRQVTWYQGSFASASNLRLSWLNDDQVEIAKGSEVVRILRLEGNASSARVGLCEWTSAEESQLHRQRMHFMLARLMADGFIKTRPLGRQAIPVSVYVRSLFFEELLRVATHREGDLTSVVTCLENTGWRFAASEESWDRFLRTRHDAYGFDETVVDLIPPSAARIAWELGGWRHARGATKHGPASDKNKWNATAVSLHMATYLGIIARWILSKAYVANSDQSDLLCMAALGFPASYGSPLTFQRSRGPSRVSHYAAMHWPSINLTQIGSLSP